MIAPVSGASLIDAPAPPAAGNADAGGVSPVFGAVLTRAVGSAGTGAPGEPPPTPSPDTAQAPPASAQEAIDPGAESALPEEPAVGASPAIIEKSVPANEPLRPNPAPAAGDAPDRTAQDRIARSNADSAPRTNPDRPAQRPLNADDAQATRAPALKPEVGAGVGPAPAPPDADAPDSTPADTGRDPRTAGMHERAGPERLEAQAQSDDAKATTRADSQDPRRLLFLAPAGVDPSREAQPVPRDTASGRSPDTVPAPGEQPADARSGARDDRPDSESPEPRERPARTHPQSTAPIDPGDERTPFALDRGPDAGVAPRAGIGPTAAQPAPGSAAPPQSAPAPQRAPDADPNASMIARGLSAAVQQRGGSVTIRLAPESLGLVRVHLTVTQETVSARLEASTPQAQRLLTEHLPMLKGSLESRGLKVERLAVQHTPAPVSAFASPAAPGPVAPNVQQPGADTGHDAAGGQSRGRGESEHRHHADNEARAENAEEADHLTDPASWRFDRRFRLRLETVA